MAKNQNKMTFCQLLTFTDFNYILHSGLNNYAIKITVQITWLKK